MTAASSPESDNAWTDPWDSEWPPITWLHRRRRWVVIVEDRDSGFRVARSFWTQRKGGAALHYLANDRATHNQCIVSLIDRKARA